MAFDIDSATTGSLGVRRFLVAALALAAIGLALSLARAASAVAAGPIRPDLDGDHASDMVVFRPGTPNASRTSWLFLTSTDNWSMAVARTVGFLGDLPIENSDFDGDGRVDPAFYRPSDGSFRFRTSGSG